MSFRLIGPDFKCHKWQISAHADAALCAHFQKIDVGINKNGITLAWVFSSGFFGHFCIVQSNNKVFKNPKNGNNYKKNIYIYFRKKNIFYVCWSSQNCTIIVFLELSSEGQIILLKKIFCC